MSRTESMLLYTGLIIDPLIDIFKMTVNSLLFTAVQYKCEKETWNCYIIVHVS